ncbi:MAG: DNA polymerase III subunit gamma/tau [Verrucomicrobia bacterium]|nr:MAG: DNA polymerase III subunit gamma/tau [Verrucomicrobiota bacterium]
MSYEVFARKYRPQTFDDVVGQTHVTRTLKNAVEQNRLAHAYLFVGPRGTGKTSTARILAKALNCTTNGPTVTPCGKCDNCREIAAGNSLDVIELDAASNRGIDDVRELRDNVRYAPAKARFKIYIIDEVHMLTKEAANALLKTLEEPPKHVIFCLATTEPEKLPITILSRCQRFDLHRIASTLIAQQLQSIARKEKLSLDPAAAHAIARGAEGGMRDAESMLDQLVAFCGENITEADALNVFGFTSQQMIADFVEKILRRETADALALVHEQCEAGKDMMKLISDTIVYLRDLLVFKVKPDALSEEATAETRAAFSKQAPLLETDRLLELIDQFAAAEGRMKWAPNKKLHFEVAVIRAIQTLDQTTLDEVIENLNALRDAKPVGTTHAGEPAAKHSAAAIVDRSAGATTAGNNADEVAIDPCAIWTKVVAQIKTRRPFIKSWIEEAHPLGASGRNFELGFPTDQRMVMEHLSSRANREFLERLLKEISGREWALKFSLKDTLPDKRPAAKGKNAPAIVREALEMFKGEIKT